MQSVVDFLNKELEEKLSNDVEVMSDPYVFLVYLVMDHIQNRSFIVYLPGSMTGSKMGDFEQCDDHESVVNEYSSGRNWRSNKRQSYETVTDEQSEKWVKEGKCAYCGIELPGLVSVCDNCDEEEEY